MGRIYLVRHGETEWNKQQRSQGCSNDIPLSEEGMIQAKAISERLKNKKIDIICSSKLQRAQQTAKQIAEFHNIAVSEYDEFLEINFGVWEGMSVPEIKREFGAKFDCWRKTPDLADIEGGESIARVQERCMRKLKELIQLNPEANILVVSHGIAIKVMVAAIIGMNLREIHRIRQDNTALNIFDYNDGIMDIITINDTSHLEAIGAEVQQTFEMK